MFPIAHAVKGVLFIAFLVKHIQSSPLNDESNDSGDFKIKSLDDIGSRIVGGVSDDIYNRPYILFYDGSCGGVILNKHWGITAAHCHDTGKHVRVGGTNFEDGMKYEVKTNIIHPRFNFKGKSPFDYDFQLLEFSEPLAFSNRVRPIPIGTENDIKLGDLVTVSGYGKTKGSFDFTDILPGYKPKLLRSVDLPIITQSHCRKGEHVIYKTITSRMFCAGFNEGQKDACQGDSGGPVVINNRLVGLVSFGDGCAKANSPGVFSKVPSVKDWIEEHTGPLDD